jgi:hypothetical protein
MPAEWTQAHLSFQVSPDGVTFNDLFDRNGAEIILNILEGTAVPIEPAWAPVTYLKLRSGSRDAPIAQEADRTISITIDTRAPTVPMRRGGRLVVATD